MLSDFGILWVTRFGRTEKGLEGDERGFECEDGRPGVLKDIKADSTGGRRDIWVVDLRNKLHLNGLEGVLIWDYDVLRKHGKFVRETRQELNKIDA